MFFETSAKNDVGIKDLFNTIAKKIYEMWLIFYKDWWSEKILVLIFKFIIDNIHYEKE